MAGEPLPDAIRVEGVAAPRYESELVAVLELAEADHKLEHGIVFLLLIRSSLASVPHGEEWQNHDGAELALLVVMWFLPQQPKERGRRDDMPRMWRFGVDTSR
uniref:Uncharacterized protein n=1 Tax=Arundo donax TaxID=35708 RepID=A0A0A9DBG9_ARUDO